MSIDFDVLVQGSSYLLEPCSDRGDDWVETHIPPGTQKWSSAYVFDQMSFAAIQVQIQRAGLGIRQVG